MGLIGEGIYTTEKALSLHGVIGQCEERGSEEVGEREGANPDAHFKLYLRLSNHPLFLFSRRAKTWLEETEVRTGTVTHNFSLQMKGGGTFLNGSLCFKKMCQRKSCTARKKGSRLIFFCRI